MLPFLDCRNLSALGGLREGVALNSSWGDSQLAEHIGLKGMSLCKCHGHVEGEIGGLKAEQTGQLAL